MSHAIVINIGPLHIKIICSACVDTWYHVLCVIEWCFFFNLGFITLYINDCA